MEHPIQLVKDVEPFMFPCPQCENECFHVVGMQPYGLGIKVLFKKNPLSTHKAYFAVCIACDTMNARLETGDFEKLKHGIIPKSMHTRYPRIALFYSLEMLKILDERFKDDPDSLQNWKESVKAYRLEV